MRLVELVPHPETLPAVMDVCLLTDDGCRAGTCATQEGDQWFALNRVQYAIVAESWRLVQVVEAMEQNHISVRFMIILNNILTTYTFSGEIHNAPSKHLLILAQR